MKHIVYIQLIVVFFSAVCAFFLFYDKSRPSDPYIVINKKIISHTEFEHKLKKKAYYQSNQDFAEQLVDTELLIQEAMSQKLHQDKDFAEKVKAFYEKNIVQLLMERKMSEFSKIKIPEIVYTRNSDYATRQVQVFPENDTAAYKMKPFISLPGDIRYRLLISGNQSTQLPDKKGIQQNYIMTETVLKDLPDIDLENQATELENLKNRYLWDTWIETLKGNATITISSAKKG